MEKSKIKNPGKITITTDGRITTAELYRPGEPTLKTVATCSPEDTFDFAIGAKLALARLIDAVNNPPIQVGDTVRVIDTGKCWSQSAEWVTKHIADKSLVAKYAYGRGLGYFAGIIKHPGLFRVLCIADDLAFIQRTDGDGTSCYLIGLDGLERIGGDKQ